MSEPNPVGLGVVSCAVVLKQQAHQGQLFDAVDFVFTAMVALVFACIGLDFRLIPSASQAKAVAVVGERHTVSNGWSVLGCACTRLVCGDVSRVVLDWCICHGELH